MIVNTSAARRRPGSHGLRAAVSFLASAAVVVGGLNGAAVAHAASAPVGQGFSVTKSDLSFILAQIKIAERHAATATPENLCGTLVGTGPDQIPSPLISKGLRTVDGSCNNLQAGQERFGSADQVFPRIAPSSFRTAESTPPGFPPAAQTPSSYAQKGGFVYDSQPRVISNLVVDQTSTNPAAVAAAGFAVRSQGGDPVVPCTTDPDPGALPPVVGVPAGCVPSHETLFIPNVTTDVGLSPPYNSLFTLFGQFFDHGVDQTVKGGGTVFVPLQADDPLIAGPDHVVGNSDDLPASQRFMVLTRARNQPGPDGILGDNPTTSVDESADDVQDAENTDSPWVDQSQTYTSHASHQVFLREYAVAGGRPVSTGRFLDGLPAGQTYVGSPDGVGGISTWASVKKQSAELLGLLLADRDVTDIPLLATDAYGNFVPGPARGLPQYVTASGLVEGCRASDVGCTGPVPVPADALHFDTPFLTDIAHNADPSPQDTDHNPGTPPVAPAPDADSTPSADFATQPAGTYDDEMLDAHFACGDGRCNENIGLSAIHQVFHSEHNRLVEDITATIEGDATLSAAFHAAHPLGVEADVSFGFGGRLFQAARFVTEMEYQHLVFEEFARKVQPAINPFEPFAFTQTELDPAVKAEFAHAVYRFGHSMLNETIDRRNEDLPGLDGQYGTSDDQVGSENDISLLDGFLNPPSYFDGGAAGTLTAQQAAGSIVMGMSDQTGNELDEFVTETLRNNLLGLPLDLATINLTRARSEGVPPLNVFRRKVFEATNDGQMTPYVNWIDFGEHLKHPESLINFVAAYGRHPSITAATTLADRREAARLIVSPDTLAGEVGPSDATAFMNSIGPWANSGTSSTTGLDTVDLWVGGLAEVTNAFGGLLGSTFNYVFENQLTELQNGDRLYYLARTPGMNLRLQLEGNSFAELMMRNTNAHSLKADSFATADCKFELRNLDGTAAGFTTFGNTVADDPQSECDESAVLLRQPDGTIKYRARNSVDPSGINGQAVYNGTAGVDRVFGGNDSDTFWGGLGSDVIEGGDGADVALGGEGDDIITDLAGDDVPKGGPGDDAIDAGPGLDIVMGGEGKDFTNGGANANETFAGDGDDFVMLGDGLDAAFGDSGDDYQEGGNQPDLMQGDSGNLFFLDDSQTPGSDVLVGQGGDDDYDMEGGDDIGVSGPGVEKVAGASGYDWEIGIGDPQPEELDLALPLVPLDILTVGVRDKFNEVEALSGGDLDDTLRGDDLVPSAVGGGGFIGCDVLDQSGIDRINGLDPLLPAPVTPLADVVANSASRSCPILSGPVWGDGNILLGGVGNDVIEGRGADDVIDGDRYLNVRLSVRNDAGVEIGSAAVNRPGQSAMTAQFLRDGNGDLTGPTLQQAVFAGTVDPGNIVLVREILAPAAPAPVCTGATLVNCDTVVFAGPRSNYVITQVPATAGELAKVTVTQVGANVVGQKASDGTDSIRNVERFRFSDQTVTITPSASVAPTALAFGNQPVGSSSAIQAVTVTNTGLANLVVSGVTVGDPSFQVTNGCTTLASGDTCTVGVLFRPTTGGPRTATLSIAHNGTGSPTTVSLTGTGVVTPAAIRVTPTALAFGNQAINTTSGVRNVTVANTGGSPLVVSGVTVTNASYLLTNGCTTVAPGASCTIGVRFRPTTTGAKPATLSIGHNAAGSPTVVALTGTGITVPGAPVIGTAASGAGGNPITARANWTPPANNGGSAITGYRVFALRMSSTAANATVLQTITSAVQPAAARRLDMTLPAGTYRFQVAAINVVGTGARSARSNAVVAR